MGVLNKVAVPVVSLTMIVAGGLKMAQLLAGESGFITGGMAVLDLILAGGGACNTLATLCGDRCCVSLPWGCSMVHAHS